MSKVKNKARGVMITSLLRLHNPYEVYTALTKNEEVKKWLYYISNCYVPPKKKALLFYPCSARKPYTASRSYKQLFKTLSKLGDKREEVHVVTVSEPFGLVPEEFYGKVTQWHDWKDGWYDCPGLFKWWCQKHSQPYSERVVEECIEILASYVAGFLSKARESYSHIIACVRTYTSGLRPTTSLTHLRLLKRASEISGTTIEFLPSKEMVMRLISEKRRLAWDFYGVAHPFIQQLLLQRLETILKEV